MKEQPTQPTTNNPPVAGKGVRNYLNSVFLFKTWEDLKIQSLGYYKEASLYTKLDNYMKLFGVVGTAVSTFQIVVINKIKKMIKIKEEVPVVHGKENQIVKETSKLVSVILNSFSNKPNPDIEKQMHTIMNRTYGFIFKSPVMGTLLGISIGTLALAFYFQFNTKSKQYIKCHSTYELLCYRVEQLYAKMKAGYYENDDGIRNEWKEICDKRESAALMEVPLLDYFEKKAKNEVCTLAREYKKRFDI